MFCLFCCFYDGVNAVQLRADFHPKKGKKNHFFPNTTTEFIHETTVYKAGREHWYGKEVCTNHRYVASTPQTSGPRWLPSCSHPQSRVLIFSALFLTIWKHEGHRDTVYHRFVSVWECAYTCARVYVLPVCEMSQICLLVSVDLAAGCIDFVSICIFLPAKNTFISSTNIDAEKQFIVFSHSAVLDVTQWLCSCLGLCRDSFFPRSN